ncbi:MAG: hypothetical protein LBP50_08165 [Tannerella sp.]|nr:hypothetical protein [Tannerella sp.]
MLLCSLLGTVVFGVRPVQARDVTVYTPYTGISVPPGEAIDYNVDVINDGSTVVALDVAVSGMPKGWEYELKSGGWKVGRISVLPGEKKNMTLKVEVPMQVNKGTYRFSVTAGDYSLPLSVTVSEQGTYKTEFTSTQSNMEGQAGATFTYSAGLRNRTAEKQLYAVTSDAPRGWNVLFRANGKQVTSVEVEPNATVNVSVEIKPPTGVKAGAFKIPIKASTGATSAQLELEAVVTGAFNIELTTPEGLLSTDITAGRTRRIDLVIRNTGSSELRDIELTANKPLKWEVSFEPQKIASLIAGATTQATAVIQASDRAIPGDYVVQMTAKVPETATSADFRITVKTSILSGWLGILTIGAVMAAVVYLFRKYGRR